MKKMKKFFAVLLALAMVLGMSMTAFATEAGTKTLTAGSITVSGLDKDATVKYVQIIRPNKETETGWEFVNATYASKFKVAGTRYENMSDQEVIWTLIKLKNGDNPVPNMPKDTKAMDASEFQAAIGTIETTQNAGNPTNGTVTISNITSAGVYAISADSTGNFRYSPMAAYVAFDSYDKDDGEPTILTNEKVTAKSSTVDITKKSNEDDKVVAVGKVVTYTLNTYIPYVSDNNPVKKYELVDRITGAEYVTDDNGDVAVTITIGEETTTIKVKPSNGSITIPLTNYLGLGTANLNKYANKAVEITYQAKVTELEVNNSVQPVDGTHEYTPVTDILHTGTVTLTKTGENSAPLKDAKFVLVDPVNNKYALVTYVPAKEATDTTEAEDAYYKVTGWTTSLDEAKANANLIVTDDQGKAVVKGLDDNVAYEFKEVVAPNGYSINEANASTKWTDKGNAATANDRQGTASMNDTKLSSLPSTGGIGTTIFTIAGCAIMIAAAGFFFASRKKANR